MLDRAFLVLNLIAESDTALSFTEILVRSELNRATLAKILRKLTEHGMLEKADGGYRIGWRAAYYGEKSPGEEGYIRQYRPALERLTREFCVSAILLRSDGKSSVCLEKVVNEHAPAMRPLGSSTKDATINPWMHILAKSKVNFDADICARSIQESARKTDYVKDVPELEALRDCLLRWPENIGDDGGLIIPHVRRLAIELPLQPTPTTHGFIVVAYLNGAELDTNQLVTAMRHYTQLHDSPQREKEDRLPATTR